MRITSLTIGDSAVIVPCCVAAEKTLTRLERTGAPTANSKINDPSRVDLDGMADLVVDTQATQQHWVVRPEKLPFEFCSVQEDGMFAVRRRTRRFWTTSR